MIEAQVTYGRLILHRGASEDGPAREELLLEAEHGKQTELALQHFVQCLETGARPLTDARRACRACA